MRSRGQLSPTVQPIAAPATASPKTNVAERRTARFVDLRIITTSTPTKTLTAYPAVKPALPAHDALTNASPSRLPNDLSADPADKRPGESSM